MSATPARAAVLVVAGLLGGCAIERGGGLVVDSGRRRDASTGGLDAALRRDVGTPDELDAGPPDPSIDAGPDAGCVARGGQCEPGETSSTSMSCGACGTTMVDQRCNAFCLWEAFPGPCMGEGECLPGTTTEYDDPACTECVRRIVLACDAGCRWMPTNAPGCDGSETCDFFVEFCEGSRGGGLECCDDGEVRAIGTCGG